MSHVQALGYLGFGVSDLEAWRDYAMNFLGLQAVEREDGSVDLRLDEYASRIRLIPDGPDDIAYVGWEVADAAALAALKSNLEDSGIEVADGSEDLAADRYVQALITFNDLDGMRCEAYYGPRQRTEQPFQSPLGVRFKTGRQGLGHIVLNSSDAKAAEKWYIDVLGLKLSDYIYAQAPSGESLSFAFLRCNARHHSLALFQLPYPKKLQHFMLEVESVDDVGRALYRAEERKTHISLTLGRHSNDEMLSAYYQTPSGFDVEYGWGGLEVDDESWHVLTHDAPSAWGHRFQIPSM
ncbi:VOC family protein [Aurantiacibacter sediminis]|uniref:VOC family protein n=1 Tax=Aurantiacibacter sediminis TaxID=2793064 RepID=A0ABS0N6V0_9SPHN|nr:VOC family protein [Aurantiacibacter sediminis]MBH5323485.1 VOC family protein [Aurantiacibacter sediminis]